MASPRDLTQEFTPHGVLFRALAAEPENELLEILHRLAHRTGTTAGGAVGVSPSVSHQILTGTGSVKDVETKGLTKFR